MSYFSVKDFINSGQKALNDKNYWCALSVALALPSMCSRVAFANEKDEYMNSKWNDKNDHSKGKYIQLGEIKNAILIFVTKL